ncbi:MAG: 5'-nucleotidase SurE [marine bacterium B5-7]|nr:MAG: 5'-nucleotidase SurE [marine bacterium B5-7]
MFILVSNDDGVYAKGIDMLAKSMQGLGEVQVIAPDRNRSGASNSLTLSAPLHAKHLEPGIISVEGTPTDCVHLAITGLLDKRPDIVVSGINAGSNLGDDVLYSGTVAAATEGRSLGLPALAFSLAGEHKHYETAGKVAERLVSQVIKGQLPANTILNINVPDVPFEELRGYEITRLGTRHVAQPMIPTKDPRGDDVYWVGPAGKEQDAGPGTDFHAIMQNKVSITPLQTDWTHYEAFEKISGWLKDVV